MAVCPTCMTNYADDVAICPHDGARLVPEATFAHVDRDLAAGDQVGEYSIEGKLGQGGFGAVFRAVHPVIGKTAAIKVLSRQYSANAAMVSRFVAEARAVNQICHRNIIDIFSFGQLPDGRQYYIMELLDGSPFDRYLASHKQLSLAQALPILRGVTRALDAAHGKGILHRDLKPENVFVVIDEDGGASAKLLDFGLVKLLGGGSGSGGEHKTATGTPMGTPYYMSPEQCRGVDVDQTTDVYAFGALVFEVLTGRVPFEGETSMDVLIKHMSAEPPRASEVCSAVPPALDEPIQRMLAKDPSARPRSVGEALASLVAAGHAAGILSASAAVSPPIDLAAAHLGGATTMDARATTGDGPVRIITGDGALAHGSTFLGSGADIARARPPRSRVALLLALALGASALAFGLFVLRMQGARGEPKAMVSTPAAAIAASPSLLAAAPAPAREPEAQDVELMVVVTPKDARDAKVMAGTHELGHAPGPFKTKTGTSVTYTVVAKGYKSGEVRATPTESMTIHVTLEKQVATVTKTPDRGKPIPSDLEGFDPRR